MGREESTPRKAHNGHKHTASNIKKNMTVTAIEGWRKKKI